MNRAQRRALAKKASSPSSKTAAPAASVGPTPAPVQDLAPADPAQASVSAPAQDLAPAEEPTPATPAASPAAAASPALAAAAAPIPLSDDDKALLRASDQNVQRAYTEMGMEAERHSNKEAELVAKLRTAQQGRQSVANTLTTKYADRGVGADWTLNIVGGVFLPPRKA